MPFRRLSSLTLFGAALGAAGACDPGMSIPDGPASLSIYLTDAPGDVAAVWVDVAEIYFQGGPGGRMTLLDEPTGLILLTDLVDRARALTTDLQVDPGTYSQLRLVLAGAVLESTDGDVYTFGGAEHPDGLAATGDLQCPGCTSSGLKVKLAGDEVAVSDGDNVITLDFDVSQSFGHAAGKSGKWIMKPVIHAVRTEGGDDSPSPDASASILGSVVLGQGEVAIPECPAGRARTLQDFMPTAAATTLVDGDGAAIVRSGAVAEDGTFKIRNVDADTYALSFANLELDAFTLVWQASVEPTEVAVADQDVAGVLYTVTGATCEPRVTGG